MSIASDVEKVISPLAASEHMEIVDVQFASEAGKKVLRIFLDKEGGINLSDCEKMSEKLGAVIDESNLVRDGYVLEVSSPGLDRVLKKEKDFVRFTGQKARITVFAPIGGQRNFTGPIVSAGGGNVTIDDVTGKQVTIQIDKIAKARLDPEI